MTRIVLFDLGDTLEHNDVLREDALETLNRIQSMENTPILGLVSDFGKRDEWGPPPSEEQIKRSQQDYYSILSDLQIDHFFDPLDQKVTLSTEVDNTKSEDIQKFFHTAIKKLSNTSLNEIIFITENIDHIRSANALGVKTIFLKLENNSSQTNGTYTISKLIESINLIEGLVNSP
jgi:FMN phosphatase YigB (HAD superfamily)